MAEHARLQTTKQISTTTNEVSVCDLPIEILDHIFSYLGIEERFRTELVCRQWRHIGKTLPWKLPTRFDDRELKKNYRKKIAPSNILPSILSRCGVSLTHLVIVHSNFLLGDAVLSLIGENCPNLVAVQLNLEISDDGLELNQNLINLAIGCPKLKEVRLRNLVCLKDTALIEFLKHCSSLECLVLNGFKLSEDFADHLNKKLKGFYVHGHANLPTVAEKLMGRCDSIEGLGVGYSNDFPTMLKLIRYYKNTLKTMYLGSCYHSFSPVDNRNPRLSLSFLYELQYLEVLSLVNCASFITDESVKLLVRHCPQLKALNIMRCRISELGISHLADAPLLTVLNASYIAMTGDGIKRVIQKGRLKKLCLDSFHRYGCYHESGCDMENICILLANCCPNLRLFIVTNNHCITNRLVQEFSSSLERGVLKNAVTLQVAQTRVTVEVEHCDKLNLNFRLKYAIEELNHVHIERYLRHYR